MRIELGMKGSVCEIPISGIVREREKCMQIPWDHNTSDEKERKSMETKENKIWMSKVVFTPSIHAAHEWGIHIIQSDAYEPFNQ